MLMPTLLCDQRVRKPQPGPSQARAKPWMTALAWPGVFESQSHPRPSQDIHSTTGKGPALCSESHDWKERLSEVVPQERGESWEV
jgi:hypothetical protein